MASGTFDVRVDQKIADASAVLQPVLNHIRGVVHDTVPGVSETIKWGMSFFELDGKSLAHMGAFKNHCSFGFWSKSMGPYLAGHGIAPEEGAGSFGKIIRVDDLPPYKQLCGMVRYAAKQVADGTWESPFSERKGPRPEPVMPDDFASALNDSPPAKENFTRLSPSCRREYLEWVTSAKRPETRSKRILEAIGLVAQGKQRNWQYMK